MSVVFTYIASRQTNDPYVPPTARDLVTLARDTADGFLALQGGYNRVGQLASFPLQGSFTGHLLCNGQEVAKAEFPELFDYLGTSQGVAVNPLNFVLPNYLVTITPAATATAETVGGGTVTSETPSDPGTGSGGSVDYAVDSGGRVRQGLPP